MGKKTGNKRPSSRRIKLAAAATLARDEELRQATKSEIDEQGLVEKHLSHEDDGLGSTAMTAMTQHRITVMKDHNLDYPELHLEVHLVGKDGGSDALFAQMFARAMCKKAKSIEEADLVVFVGGPDVNPALYGEKPHPRTHTDDERDTDDINAYLYCMQNGIPMLGVCRGAQFLHVMQGGKLYQHIDEHNGDHSMWDIVEKTMLEKVSSVHHQMVIANNDMKVLGTSSKAKNRWRNPFDMEKGTKADVEAYFYRDTCCIGVQGHPEYRGYNYFAVWVLKQIQKYVVENPDLEYPETASGKGRFRRLKPDALEQAKLNAGVTSTISQGVK